MKVYEFEGFPNPARVRVALAEKNLTDQVEFVQIDLLAGEHRAATFLEKNPSGAVPVLELEDGTTISECTAITEYLDHVSGEPTLTGRTPQERAVINMMQRRAEAGVMDTVSAYFHHATPGLGRISKVTRTQNGANTNGAGHLPGWLIWMAFWLNGPTWRVTGSRSRISPLSSVWDLRISRRSKYRRIMCTSPPGGRGSLSVPALRPDRKALMEIHPDF